MLTVDGSTRISDAHGVLTVKDDEDKKTDKSETPVNPTDGNHSSDDKTSKPSDNNQPSADKEYKQQHRRIQILQFADRSANDNNSLDVHQVEVPVSDRRSVAEATEIATPVPEALVSAGPSVPTNTVEEKVVTETETPKSAKSEEDVKSHEVAQADKVTKSDERQQH